MTAEEVLGRAGPEAIARQRITPGDKLELLMRNDDVEKAGHPAHRAITLEGGHRRFRQFRLEPHGAAMTPARSLHSLPIDIMRVRPLIERLIVDESGFRPERRGAAVAERPF